MHKSDIIVPDHDLGHQRLMFRHDGQQHRTGRHHRADSVGRNILHDAGLRRLQFQQPRLVFLLEPVLFQLAVLPARINPLVLQIAAIFRGDLGDLFPGLVDCRFQTGDR